MKLPIKIFDIVILFLAAGITIFSAYAAYMKPNDSLKILIRGSNGKEWIFQIDADETVTINGSLGDTVVKIHGKKAWVESSPCENQTCVATGFIFRQGQWAACLPNNVLLMVLGNGDDDVDALVW